jgi:hypothetical protein
MQDFRLNPLVLSNLCDTLLFLVKITKNLWNSPLIIDLTTKDLKFRKSKLSSRFSAPTLVIYNIPTFFPLVLGP